MVLLGNFVIFNLFLAILMGKFEEQSAKQVSSGTQCTGATVIALNSTTNVVLWDDGWVRGTKLGLRSSESTVSHPVRDDANLAAKPPRVIISMKTIDF